MVSRLSGGYITHWPALVLALDRARVLTSVRGRARALDRARANARVLARYLDPDVVLSLDVNVDHYLHIENSLALDKELSRDLLKDHGFSLAILLAAAHDPTLLPSDSYLASFFAPARDLRLAVRRYEAAQAKARAAQADARAARADARAARAGVETAQAGVETARAEVAASLSRIRREANNLGDYLAHAVTSASEYLLGQALSRMLTGLPNNSESTESVSEVFAASFA